MLKKLAVVGIAAATLTLTNLPVASSAAPDGKAIFNAKCAACHQATGVGVPGAFPPLAKNPNVTGDPKKPITTVVKGQQGPLKVNGQTYNGVMQAWRGAPPALLSNAEIAAVLTYVRSSWGNKAAAVTEAQVAGVK
jgi:nitrite reductase (NO-forming)/hydroxylamine reductase